MLYKYSEPVDHKTYRNDGLAHDIPLRVHKDSQKEITGARRAQEDWSRLMGSIDEFHGVMAERFSMISVTIPECLPERLEIVSYANEFAFLYDGASHIGGHSPSFPRRLTRRRSNGTVRFEKCA